MFKRSPVSGMATGGVPPRTGRVRPGRAGVDLPIVVRTVGKTAFSGEPTPGRKLERQATDFNRWSLTAI